ncbi:META domain-containing protein [Shewanella sp. Isolate13]|uniref:META domain-containing protein n=1 Tax=Shewanella sp. Isolate13 TaxID=2908531 RepID=UPI001EFC2E47|nr:META domain-containing protein [Shewanella sp. Isolate13]MCG9730110.1 META domain-containing protein [Shewanella sp. Isolate13]
MIKQSLIVASLLLGLTACQSTSPTQIEDLAIEGTWHIESANGQPVIDYSPAQLTFEAEGKLTGNNSCNNFFGNYVLAGQSLQLQPAGSTMKACVDALMAQEQRVMQVIPAVTQAQMANGKLLLKDADNKTILILSKM